MQSFAQKAGSQASKAYGAALQGFEVRPSGQLRSDLRNFTKHFLNKSEGVGSWETDLFSQSTKLSEMTDLFVWLGTLNLSDSLPVMLWLPFREATANI